MRLARLSLSRSQITPYEFQSYRFLTNSELQFFLPSIFDTADVFDVTADRSSEIAGSRYGKYLEDACAYCYAYCYTVSNCINTDHLKKGVLRCVLACALACAYVRYKTVFSVDCAMIGYFLLLSVGPCTIVHI